ncbi:diguanylate cyclase domain protein [Methyloversatilis sp. RAC08]|uniref:bifunctional diguanylate cyclase/phosphodiesterase n=1 Tax=Methyloversatilis sp. RAC08 TaxID=1842540 RepID=UPI00083DBCAD|nr:EAL domain-containing protein [Methyloversatilis sp. RAC08]AOF81175.1 diguanylate cyclase domain protein [Methyloversatilis sp. RAC08]
MSFSTYKPRRLSLLDRSKPLAVALVALLSGLALTAYIADVEADQMLQRQRDEVAAQIGVVRARLESEINSAAHLSLGLVSYVAANPTITEDAFYRVSERMLAYGRHVRSIALAPDNVLRFVHPLAGNEAALGLRYLDHPAQRDAVLKMMESRRFVLAGPLELVQGGVGLINRFPIYLPAGDGSPEKYWGLASIVLHFDTLLKASGLLDADQNVRYALRGRDGMGAAGEVIHGDPDIFSLDPVKVDVVLPDNARWQLAAVPIGGWRGALQDTRVINIWMAGSLVSLAIAGLLGLGQLQIRRIHLRDADLSLAASVIESSNEAIVVTDEGDRIVSVNPAFSKLTGQTREAVLGKLASAVVSTPYDASSHASFVQRIDAGGDWSGELDDRRADGETYPKRLSIYPVGEQGGDVHYVHSFSDISERKAAERKIHHLAHHDALTGLPNRLSLQGRMEQAMAEARRHGTLIAVMMIDMDHFKDINDTLGHHVGDALLVDVAQRLLCCVRLSDVVARLGGDEFVVLVTDMASTLTAAAVAEKIVSALSAPYQVEAYRLHSTPSVGIGVFPNDGTSVDTLLRNVDTAMYHAKAAGRNNYQFFDQSMSANASERLALQGSLHHAIETRQFVLHYQPQIEVASGRLVGVEALVRWQHPERGLVPPNSFIPIAEESDLIIKLGEWILQEACWQLSRWKDQGLKLRVSVNLSARQLRSKNLLHLVEDTLIRHDLRPGDLELEITESVAMDNPDATLRMLGQLRELGVELAIDDFGTGYSSLSHLKLMPLQRLKIDRSFVKDIESDPDDAAICAATISLAQNLGLSVVAEGVETDAQLAFLGNLGCECVQGYLFSKPLPAAEFEVWAAQRAAAQSSLAS